MKLEFDNIYDVFDAYEFSYANKEYLWFLLLIPLFVFFYYLWDYKNPKHFKFSTLAFFGPPSSLSNFRHLIPVLRSFTIGLLIIAFARPQDILDESYQSKVTEGIDIVLAIDVSTSMDALDLSPDRLGAAKEKAKEFVANRPNDRIGLVIFDGEAITQCPLTTDHKYLTTAIDDIYSGMVVDGTAIGNGLITAVNRLRESKSKSKVVILLTDGKNTHGNVDPITAADIARAYNVRVYTIAVGDKDKAPYEIVDMFGRKRRINLPSEVDTKTLQAIADKTNGIAYRAQNDEALGEVYASIDKLEKDKVKITKFRVEPPEKFHGFVMAAFFFFILELILRFTILRSLTFER